MSDELNARLFRAIQKGDSREVALSLIAGASVYATDYDSRTALLIAACLGHAEIADILLWSRTNTPPPKCLRDGEITEIVLLPEADVNATDMFGQTALITAAFMGHAEVVKVLLSAGADMNMRANGGGTALHYAKKEGHSEVVRILEEAGAKE